MDNNNSNIDTEGNVPKRRFINPQDPLSGEWLYAQVQNFTMVGNTKDWERGRVEAHLRMANPYSQDDLVALGMENMPNASRGDLAMRVSAEEGKYTDLVTSHSGLWEARHPLLPPEIAERFQSELAEALNTAWSEVPAHVLTMQLVFRQFSTWGIGPALWVDPYDPAPIARISSDLKFPPGTRIDLSNFSECAMWDKMNAQGLYRSIMMDDTKHPSAWGWKKDKVMDVLKAMAPEDTKQYFNSAEAFELAIRDGNNPWKHYRTTEIQVIHCWVEEFEGEEKDGVTRTVSYVMLAQGAQKGWVVIRDLPRSMELPRNFMLLATDRVGSDGLIGGLRGMAVEMRPRAEMNDILHNAAAYGAFLNSVPIFKSTNQAVSDRAEQITPRANGLIVPDGLDQVEAKLEIREAMQFIASNNNEMDEAQGRYSLNAPNKGGVQRTAEEARQDSAKEGEIRSSQIVPLTATFFGPLGQIFFDRINAYPKDDEGVPLKYCGWRIVQRFGELIALTSIPAALKSQFGDDREKAQAFMAKTKIMFNSSNTPGGLDKKLLKARELGNFVPLMTSQSQRDAVLENGAVALFGWSGAKPYLNNSESQQVMTGFAQVISMENGIMLAGQPQPVQEFQDHMRHLGPLDPRAMGHMATLMQKLAQVAQGNEQTRFEDDPLDGLAKDINTLLALKEHCESHLSFAAHIPGIMESKTIQPYFVLISQAEGVIKQLVAGFQKELAARAEAKQPQQTDPKAQAIIATTQANIQAKQMTTAADMQMSEQKHNLKMAQQAQLAGTRSDLKTAQTISDMAVSAQKQQAEAINETTKALRNQAQVAQLEKAKLEKDSAGAAE